MSLLNKEEKTTTISPVIESKKWSYTPSNLVDIMEDDIVRQKWEDYMRIVNKKNSTERMATGILFHHTQFCSRH